MAISSYTAARHAIPRLRGQEDRHLSCSASWHFRLFVKIYLACLMGANSVLLASADGQESSNFIYSWIVLYAVSVGYFFMHGIRVLRRDRYILYLIIMVCASLSWSNLPSETAKYSASLSLNAIFALSLRQTLTLRDLLLIVLETLLLLASLGLVLSIAGVELVRYVDVHDRVTYIGTEPVRGLFNHKITAGLYSAIGLILSIAMIKGTQRIIAVSIFSILILLSGSTSAIPAVFVGLAAPWITKKLAAANVSARTFLKVVASTLIATIIMGNVIGPLVLFYLNRDVTLTGRTLLWSLGLEVGLLKPILGWGYYGYLGSSTAEQIFHSIRAFKNYDVPHFHNSYVQMFVDLGAVGLLASLAIPFTAMRSFYDSFKGQLGKEYVTATVTIIVILFAAFAVHVFYKHNNFTATLLLAFAGYASHRPKIGVNRGR